MAGELLSTCSEALRLALYSDQVIAANRRLDREVLRFFGAGRIRIGYLASAPDPERCFFDQKRAYYAQHGEIDLAYFEPEGMGAPAALRDLLACDAIHLTGGKTRGYLDRILRANLVDPLRDYAARGRPVIGTSAGAILMTATIAVDALFEGSTPLDSPERAALNLVPFEFFPHLQADPGYLAALARYSKRNGGRPIFACADGDGILVEAGAAMAVGAVTEIRDGAVIQRGGGIPI